MLSKALTIIAQNLVLTWCQISLLRAQIKQHNLHQDSNPRPQKTWRRSTLMTHHSKTLPNSTRSWCGSVWSQLFWSWRSWFNVAERSREVKILVYLRSKERVKCRWPLVTLLQESMRQTHDRYSLLTITQLKTLASKTRPTFCTRSKSQPKWGWGLPKLSNTSKTLNSSSGNSLHLIHTSSEVDSNRSLRITLAWTIRRITRRRGAVEAICSMTERTKKLCAVQRLIDNLILFISDY